MRRESWSIQIFAIIMMKIHEMRVSVSHNLNSEKLMEPSLFLSRVLTISLISSSLILPGRCLSTNWISSAGIHPVIQYGVQYGIQYGIQHGIQYGLQYGAQYGIQFGMLPRIQYFIQYNLWIKNMKPQSNSYHTLPSSSLLKTLNVSL